MKHGVLIRIGYGITSRFGQVWRDAMRDARSAVWPFQISDGQRSSAPARRRTNRGVISYPILSALLLSTSSYAGIINGGFETGTLANWTAGGSAANVQVLTSGQFAGGTTSIAPSEGNFYALLSNGPGEINDPSATFDVTTLTSMPYLVGANASISFVLDFFTNELPPPDGFPDFYEVSVLIGNSSTQLVGDDFSSAQNLFADVDCGSTFLTAPDGTTVCSHSGLQSFNNLSLVDFANQTVRFQFLVSDAIDNSFDSALMVDAVEGVGLTPVTNNVVPEPSSLLLLSLGTVPFAARRMVRRKKQRDSPLPLACMIVNCPPGHSQNLPERLQQ